ncbi:Plasma membrane sulfite pump involved in sulfite metabolism [Coemansia sp. S16]|nr:Plasma membrane sulfite pump involved in sulfite metabolism [Coemansia sp. S16]
MSSAKALATRSIEAVTGAWLLLVAPLTVCAAAGGTLAEYLPSGAAYTTLVCSYCLAGAGVPLTCCVVVLYMHRIAIYKLPAHDAILTAFIPLGPVAQIGVAALTLGLWLGPVLFSLGVVTGLLSWGSTLFWAMHAVFAVAYQRRSGCVPFNISWWALTFPVGVFATLTAGLGDVLELNFFRVCFLLLVGLLVVLWLFNIARTVAGLWTGAIFDIPGLMATYDSDTSCAASSV